MLKKLASILLLAIFVFNLFGYRLVADYLEQRSDEQMQAQLDENDYNPADLISLKVPVQLPPYTNTSEAFESINGNVNIGGVNYKYVKRRFVKDTMEVLCLPNMERTGIMSARDEFSKLANDFLNYSSKKATGHNSKSTYNIKNTFSDFDNFSYQYKAQNISSQIAYSLSRLSGYINTKFHLTPEQPPDVA